MKRHLVTLVAVLTALVALPGAASAVDNDNPIEGQAETGGAPVSVADGSHIQWSLYAGGKPIASGIPLSLKAHDGYLASGRQRFGINLQFYPAERRSWRIVRTPGASGPCASASASRSTRPTRAGTSPTRAATSASTSAPFPRRSTSGSCAGRRAR